MPNALIKVLFISREKQDRWISPVVQAQADSLNELVDISIFSIRGKGWRSYFKGISALRKHLGSNNIDLVHAHFSYIGMVASLATRKLIVVSLMGSDVEDFRFGRILIRLFSRFSWKKIIIKSGSLKEKIRLKEAIVIPNGVDLDIFAPIPHDEARKEVGFDLDKKYVIFLADPARPEKNFKLATESCELLAGSWGLEAGGCELLAVHEQAHSEIPLYLSAADVLLLTSHFEGSPNAIKEAMACNRSEEHTSELQSR